MTDDSRCPGCVEKKRGQLFRFRTGTFGRIRHGRQILKSRANIIALRKP